MVEDLIKRAALEIKKAKKALALTGAGISAESGIPLFRGKGGLWKKYDPEEYAHIETFRKTPEKSWSMLKDLLFLLMKSSPNPGHIGLAKLEKMGYLEAIITQNVDGLHQEAGSQNVIEFHGNNQYLVCLDCGKRYRYTEISLEKIPPKCGCQGVLKPDAVFFGEPIPLEALYKAEELASACDLMLVIGTSGIVYPAANMPRTAKKFGAKIIEINPEKTPLSDFIADIFIKGKAGVIIPRIVDELVALEENQ